ncbi:MAG: DUF1330 domain-containing protein [Kangiellaceae bacterium]|nr:DUF1330 domain-containing protein [Kangiellaceae bacterium]MCW9016258.1 DUF1330 domain-containing protein [Kangiellaceae bacterium]
MSAYIIVHVKIEDQQAYAEYTKRTPKIIESFGGKFIVRGGQTETLEGEKETLRLVVIEFPSMKNARAFYQSEEYQTAKKFREGAGEAKFVLVDGYPIGEWEKLVK